MLCLAFTLASCDPPSDSSSSKSTPSGIDKGIDKGKETKTENPNVAKVADAPAFGSDARITYYTVKTDEKVVQLKHTTIGSDIKGDVSYTVTQVGTSTQVGYIADISGIKPNADDANQLDIPQNTVGFFEVQVSAKDDAANKSGKILLAAGSIAIPDAAIILKDPDAAGVKDLEAKGVTVDKANKTVLLVDKGNAGKNFTVVAELDKTKFADGVPKYALTYSAEGTGSDKLVQAINSSTGQVTLGSGGDRAAMPGVKVAAIEVKVSGEVQGPYAARAETTLVTLKPKPRVLHVSTFAGSGGFGSQDGIGTAARLMFPNSIAGSRNTLYFLQSGETGVIRRLTVNTAEVTTLVTGGSSGYTDGNGTVAQFNAPWGIAINGDTLYVSDSSNHRIREVAIGATAAATQVSLLAGSGTAGHANGAGATAQFNGPMGLAVSGDTLYVADNSNHRIRAINLTSKTVRDIAGSGTAGNTDATGTDARFHKPQGIATDGTTLYIADYDNHRIRTIDIASKEVSTLAGSTAGYKDGVGTAAQFNNPTGIALSGTTLYIAEQYNNRIRAIDIASKEVSTLAGSTAGYKDGVGTAAQFNNPTGIAVSGNTLYITDVINNRIRKIEYK